MDPERFARLREVVDRALALPSSEREHFVKTEFTDDPELARESLAYLSHEETAGRALTDALDDQIRVAASRALGKDPLPETIGDFSIVAKLGEGGMGIVYQAEQTGALERTVALKLIRAGWSNRRVIARFESERLALARMNHPNIAKVFDAGETDDGLPWFAMELVDGLPLTEWCDAHLLDTKERLTLFLAVCRGVQHAHQKGIIHRDLKPSNVLVAGRESGPVPKIIDFGIAKALVEPGDAQATLTMSGQRFGSPDYMSPERIEGDSDVDIRSDVYSLGVLLFELLSGRLPFDHSSSPSRGFGSGSPSPTRHEPPSLAKKATGDPALTVEIAAKRSTDPAHLRRTLKGELDWVVAKALAPDRDNRYGTARELMQDLERYLAHEPVQAGRPGLFYRMGKFARRYRVPVTVAAIVVTALTVGLVESRRQRLRADLARDQAETVTAFLSDMLSSVQPEEEGRDVTVVQVLDNAAGNLDQGFTGHPLVRAQLQSTIGQTYTVLGELDDAIEHLESSLATFRRELGDNAPETLAAMCDLGQAVTYDGQFDRAGTLYREALAGYRNLPDNHTRTTCQALNGLGNALAGQGRIEDSVSCYLDALEAAREKLSESDPLICSLMNNLALSRADQGRLEECRDLLARVLELRRQSESEDHPQTLESVVNLAGIDSQLGNMDEAIFALEDLVPRARRVLGDSHRVTLGAVNNLAWAYGQVDRLPEAETLTRETLDIRRLELGEGHPETMITAFNLADILQREGRLEEAEDLHRQTYALRARNLGKDHTHTRLSATALADLLRAQGREAAADSLESKGPDEKSP